MARPTFWTMQSQTLWSKKCILKVSCNNDFEVEIIMELALMIWIRNMVLPPLTRQAQMICRRQNRRNQGKRRRSWEKVEVLEISLKILNQFTIKIRTIKIQMIIIVRTNQELQATIFQTHMVQEVRLRFKTIQMYLQWYLKVEMEIQNIQMRVCSVEVLLHKNHKRNQEQKERMILMTRCMELKHMILAMIILSKSFKLKISTQMMMKNLLSLITKMKWENT